MTTIEFSAVVALVGIYALLMFAMFSLACVRSLVRRKHQTVSAALEPEIRNALVDYIAGNNDISELRDLAAKGHGDIARTMMTFQGALSGSSLDRLCSVALELGLIKEWIQETRSRDPVARRAAFSQLAFVSVYEPSRRLTGELLIQGANDTDPEVRIAACRALVQSGGVDEVELAFDTAISETVLVRTLLAEDLRRHAVMLCERAIPAVLRAPDVPRATAALDMLVAWERAIPLENLDEVLRHQDRQIKILALRLAWLVPQSAKGQAAIQAALADTDPDVTEAAAGSAGRMVLLEAMPLLARLLRIGPARVARTAAAALGDMPPRGRQTLEELAASPNAFTAAAAKEALARLRYKATA